MLRTENHRTAKQFSESLRSILDACTSDVDELKRSFDKGPLGTASEAVAFTTTLQKEVSQLRTQVPPLVALSHNTPRTGEMLSAAYAQLNAVSGVLDAFEKRMQEAYGIAPCDLSKHEECVEKENVPSSNILNVSTMSAVSKPETGLPLPAGTPRKEPASPVDEPLAATPRLEDFGITDADIRALAMPTPGFQRDAVAVDGTPRYQLSLSKATGVDIAEGDNYDEMVAKSMSALGIETPVEVAEKFAARRHIALKGVMQSTTPRMKSGGVERTLDYTGLAGGYYGITTKDARTLNFDETPVVGGGLRERVRERFDEMSGFWKSGVEVEALQEAAVLLSRERGREFGKMELLEFLVNALPRCNGQSMLVGLTKMKVVHPEKPVGGNAVYRYVF